MKKVKIEIKWAVIFTAIAVLWMLMERLVGLHGRHVDKHAVFTNLFAVPAVALYVLALLDKRKNYYQGKMTFLQGFVSGLVITLVVVLLNPLTQWVVATIVTPGFYQNAIDYNVSAGKMTLVEAENYFALRSYILHGFIGIPAMGAVTAAVTAFFCKTKNEKPDT